MSKREIKDYPGVSFDGDNIEGFVEFESVFGRKGPLHIEIGSGKGTFLVSQARHMPEANFFGIEWANKYYRYAVDRIGRWGLSNVRMTRTDAAVFVGEHVRDGEVDCFHIYFPDPWPKARHHKRRLICRANIEQFLRSLRVGGVINIATDHLEYFEWMREAFLPFIEAGQVEEIEFIKPAGAGSGELAGTNFERKYLKQGRAINTIALKKL